ncbi:MAG TPA: Ig-like domain-containing protein [Thermoanaerobaculia bacterium]|nr:Ig-like domain-containing protein [Thermoanaerobaculia bacterium]
MRRSLVAFAVIAFALSGCKWESPTEPAEIRRQAADADPLTIFTMDPDVVVVRPGETRTATIRALWPYPLGVEFFSSDPSVVTIRGRIVPGQAEGTVVITGVAAGQSLVSIRVPNFARPPGYNWAGTIVITGAPVRPRRRGVGH